jgi:hypothetical protein
VGDLDHIGEDAGEITAFLDLSKEVSYLLQGGHAVSARDLEELTKKPLQFFHVLSFALDEDAIPAGHDLGLAEDLGNKAQVAVILAEDA